MKSRIIALFFVSLLALTALSACSRHDPDDRFDSPFDNIDDMMENAAERQEESLEQAARRASAPSSDGSHISSDSQRESESKPSAEYQPTSDGHGAQNAEPQLTREEAQEIALAHAGLTADAVSYLRVEYDYDDGRPEYNVEFYHDHWEYDYEIHAESGKILSFDKDR